MNEIQVLKGLEAVRLRPGMYIGGTDKKALHHLVWEIIDNSIDEHLAKDSSSVPYCDSISVTIEDDGETVVIQDNGRGIPVSVHTEYEKEGTTQLELALTKLHAGGKFTHNVASGGLHGVGISCVNALSDFMKVKVMRDGGIHEQTFSKGIPTSKTLLVGETRQHGTIITFHPDPEIFHDTLKFDEDLIITRLRECSMLNGGLKISFHNKKTGSKHEFINQNGLADYVMFLSKERNNVYPVTPIHRSGSFLHKNGKHIEVEYAIQYASDDYETIRVFANNIINPDGGTHLSGFYQMYTRVINQFARSSGILKEKSSNLQGEDIREGIIAVVSVKIPQPQFESQTKVKLVSQEAAVAVSSVLNDTLVDFFEKTPSLVETIVKRAVISQEAREKAKQAQEAVKRKSALGKTYRLPGKLSDCNSDDRGKSELFLVEGDSAAGPAIQGRNAEFQAILPLRGKIINAEKHDLVSFIKNSEVQDLISAIGAGYVIGSDTHTFDINKLRYDKIIILTDADVDGSHIATLILAFFYKLMPDLIHQGHVYLACPPLYRIKYGKKIEYIYTSEEKDAKIDKINSKFEITRFKGLGEMNFDELRDTTMDVSTRRLVKVCVQDKIESDKMFSVLMGSNVSLRKEHIIMSSSVDEE